MKHVRKAYGYVTRKHNGTMQVLVFTHKFVPEAGTQIPKGTFKENESPLEAVTREIIEETGLTNFRVEREIAVDQWKYHHEADEVEERHFFLLTVPHPGDDEAPGAADEWDHAVTGDGEDEGMVFHCFWVRNSLPKKRMSLCLVSTATHNPLPDGALASATDTSGHPDKVPVLAQHGCQTTSERGALFDQECFTQTWFLVWNPGHSVGKERDEANRLSLPRKSALAS